MLKKFSVAAIAGMVVTASAETKVENIQRVAAVPGLVAFWSFNSPQGGVWHSLHDPATGASAYPLYLRRIGDGKRHSLDSWPYSDDNSRVRIDTSGPFGHALYCNKGYIYVESPRSGFDRSPLDICGDQPFTMIAWVKFTGSRHLVAGIWDEGGWDKYRGRRQVALFGGLFGRRGITAHISSSGAASYPQSTIRGSQYARERALDGANFTNHQWVCMAMTFDPATHEVKAWLDGAATPLENGDEVENDVFDSNNPQQANPYRFNWPLYSPRRFILKYNGYNARTDGVYEHWLDVKGEDGRFVYGRSAPRAINERFKVSVNVTRSGTTLAGAPLEAEVQPGAELALPSGTKIVQGDVVTTSLAVWREGGWVLVGQEITYPVPEGAPFTVGRALGLGKEQIEHGSQLYVDGVAVFNRVLTAGELKAMTFVDRTNPTP